MCCTPVTVATGTTVFKIETNNNLNHCHGSDRSHWAVLAGTGTQASKEIRCQWHCQPECALAYYY